MACQSVASEYQKLVKYSQLEHGCCSSTSKGAAEEDKPRGEEDVPAAVDVTDAGKEDREP